MVAMDWMHQIHAENPYEGFPADPLLQSSYQFYLARSYRDCGEKEKALQAYLTRAELGFWVEEVYISLYEAAKLQETLGRPFDEVVATYLRAADAVPSRAEALHGASRYCRLQGRHKEGYEIAKRASPSEEALDGLFVEPWIYEYGLLDELAVNAYWAGAYQDSLDACERILRERKCPEAERPRIEANADFARQQIRGRSVIDLFQRALVDHQARRLQQAEAAYRHILAIDPAHADTHTNLGDALNAVGRPAEGEASYREALRLRSNYPEAHNYQNSTTMLTLCVLTFYPENLLISLSRLRNYRDYPFKLIIHNDNPAEKVFFDYVDGILNRPDVFVLIHNNEENMAHFNSRLNVIRLMKENPALQSKWFIFIDDDDVLLTPRLIDGYAPVLNHNALVVRRLREVLSLIRDPNYYSGRSKFMEEDKPKVGCTGIPYDMQTYFEFYDRVQGFLPTLYQIYGTERVMEPDDVILQYMFRIFLENKLGLEFAQMRGYMAQFAQDSYSYAITHLEDRRGRYPVAPGVADLRYGDNPTGISYESLYYAITEPFYNYLGMKQKNAGKGVL